MKFSIEVDIDWISDEEGLDEAINNRLINNLATKIEKEFANQSGKDMAKHAENLVKAKTELIIQSVLEKPVVISNGWQSNTTYDSIYDMVEKRMTSLYEGKILAGKNACEKDPLLGRIENFVNSSVKQLLSDIEKRAKYYAEEEAKKAVLENAFVKKITEIVG